MSSLIDKAAAKLAMECEKNEILIPFEEYLTEKLSEDIAPMILDPNKTLNGAYREVYNHAKLIQKNGYACIRSEDAFRIVDRYFRIENIEAKTEVETESADINIMDFL